MSNYYQNNVPGFRSTSKPSPAAPDYDEFLLEYISSDTMDRLDILACNSEIDGFIVFFDDQISIMSDFEWQRTSKTKKLLGLTGHPLQYYLFSADATDVVLNFASYLFTSPTYNSTTPKTEK